MTVFLWFLFLVAGTADAGDDALAPGSILDRTTAAAAERLLAPEVLAHYAAGEYRNTIGRWPATPPWEEAFASASSKNATRYDVDARGTIVERGSGKPAGGIVGLPFRVEASDPQAGVKTVWNVFYALWRIGSSRDGIALEWVGKGGREREALLDSHTLYYEGVARPPAANPLGLAFQQRAVVTAPADLNGTASLSWRFRAADQRDQSWAYVPALRRVRQVSPANRSDGFLGSDLSLDDGSVFDGKPEDFTWRLVGEREALVLADPRSLADTVTRRARPDGGIEEEWAENERVAGFQDPNWTGLPWAPIAPVLVRRRLWQVEAVPRDPYYLFAKIEIGIDQETFQGASSRKFDARGGLLRSLQFCVHASQPIEVGGSKLLLPASSMSYIGAENPKASRATVVIAPPGRSTHQRRVPLETDLFTLERLSTGK